MAKYIVELEKGVWIAGWRGDPGRTLDISHAKRFWQKRLAENALKRARRYRPFLDAKIIEVSDEE